MSLLQPLTFSWGSHQDTVESLETCCHYRASTEPMQLTLVQYWPSTGTQQHVYRDKRNPNPCNLNICPIRLLFLVHLNYTVWSKIQNSPYFWSRDRKSKMAGRIWRHPRWRTGYDVIQYSQSHWIYNEDADLQLYFKWKCFNFKMNVIIVWSFFIVLLLLAYSFNALLG